MYSRLHMLWPLLILREETSSLKDIQRRSPSERSVHRSTGSRPRSHFCTRGSSSPSLPCFLPWPFVPTNSLFAFTTAAILSRGSTRQRRICQCISIQLSLRVQGQHRSHPITTIYADLTTRTESSSSQNSNLSVIDDGVRINTWMSLRALLEPSWRKSAQISWRTPYDPVPTHLLGLYPQQPRFHLSS